MTQGGAGETSGGPRGPRLGRGPAQAAIVRSLRWTATRADRLVVGAARELPGALRAGALVGAATSVAYVIDWLTIALTGGPGGIVWSAFASVLQAIALAAALYRLAARPASAAGWQALPELLVVLVVLLLAEQGAALGTSSFIAETPFAYGGYLLWLLAFGLFFWPWLLLWPGACRPASEGSFAALRSRLRVLGWRSRWLWLLEAVVILGVWQVLRPALSWVLREIVPFPALSSLLQAAAFALGWAAVAGRLVPKLLSLAGALPDPGRSTAPPAAPANGAAGNSGAGGSGAVGGDGLGGSGADGGDGLGGGVPRRGLIGGVIVGLLLALFLLLSPNLPQVPLVQVITIVDGQARLASLEAEGLFAMRQGAAAIGDTFAMKAVLSSADGRQLVAGSDIADAAWWAPQSDEVERIRAWLAATSGPGTGLAESLFVLQDLGDHAGVDQARALWATRRGGSDRTDFFDALQRDPSIELAMPGSSAGSGVTGTRTQLDVSSRLMTVDRTILGDAVVDAGNRHAFVESVADEHIIEALYADAPTPSELPTVTELESAAGAMALSGDEGDAITEFLTAFNQSHDPATKDRLASEVLYLAALHNPGSADAAVVAWVTKRGDAPDAMALGMAEFLQGQRPAALSEFELVARLHPDATTEAQALAATGEMDYLAGDDAAAVAAADRALALGVPSVVPAAQAVAGDAILATRTASSVTEAEARLEKAAGAYPYSFMVWYTLGQLADGQSQFRQAALDDLKALTAYELDVRAGIGRLDGVVNPSGSIWQIGTDPYGVPHFIASLQQAMAAAEQKAQAG